MNDLVFWLFAIPVFLFIICVLGAVIEWRNHYHALKGAALDLIVALDDGDHLRAARCCETLRAVVRGGPPIA